MSDEEKVQSLIAEMRVLESILNDATSRQAFLIRIIGEAKAGITALKELSASSSEVLVPLGGGLFLKVNAQPPDKILVGLGADVVVEKSKDEAVSYAEERVKEVENAVMGLEAQRNDLTRRMFEKREAVSSIVAKQQGLEGSVR